MKSRLIIKIGIIAVLAAIIVFFTYNSGVLAYVNHNTVREYISSYGEWAGIIFVLIFVLRTFAVFFPYSIMIIAGGSLFGLSNGFLLSYMAAFISASLAYLTSKAAGKKRIEKYIIGKVLKMDEKLGANGFKVLLLTRLSMMLPFDAPNYAIGLTRIKYPAFITATMLGIIPEMISFSFIGSSIGKPLYYNYIVIGILAIIIIVQLLFKFYRNGKRSTS